MKGVLEIHFDEFFDSRGTFSKLLSKNLISESCVSFDLAESFSSFSHVGVVRGMHMQTGESENTRFIYVLEGSVFDQIIDLRAGSPTLGAVQARSITSRSGYGLMVPPGVAHGFQALEPARMLYFSNKEYVPELDKGVNPVSDVIRWPIPISSVSERDLGLPDVQEYINQIK